MVHRASASAAFALLLVAAASTAAGATTFSFSYGFTSPLGGGTLSGTFEGALQPDGDTIVVSDLLSAEYSLAPHAVFFLPSLGGLQASLSGSGTTNLVAPPRAGFGSFTISSISGGAGVFDATGVVFEAEAFDPANLNVVALPGPPAWLSIAGSGLAWLAARLRRR